MVEDTFSDRLEETQTVKRANRILISMLRQTSFLLLGARKAARRPPWTRPELSAAIQPIDWLVEADSNEVSIRSARSSVELVSSIVEIVPNRLSDRACDDADEHHSFLTVTADRVFDNISIFTEPEKVKILCAFGTLYRRKKRPERYFAGPLAFSHPIYSSLLNLIDPIAIHAEAELPLLRIWEREGGRGEWGIRLLELLGERVSRGGIEIDPPALTEMALIAGRVGRIIPAQQLRNFLSSVSLEISSYSEHFSSDQIGDVARALNSSGHLCGNFRKFLDIYLLKNAHTIPYWSLIDLGEFLAKKPDNELCTRIANEIWKFIPEMRSPYHAKALIMLSEFQVGDRRTVRGLLLGTFRNSSLLSQVLLAKCLTASVRLGFTMTGGFGNRKPGDLWFRKILLSFLGGNGRGGADWNRSDKLKEIPCSVLCELAESLAAVNRPVHQLFDFLFSEISRRARTADLGATGLAFSGEQIATISRSARTLGYQRGLKDPDLLFITDLSHLSSDALGELLIIKGSDFQVTADEWMRRIDAGDYPSVSGLVSVLDFLTDSNYFPSNLIDLIANRFIPHCLKSLDAVDIGKVLFAFAGLIGMKEINISNFQVLTNAVQTALQKAVDRETVIKVCESAAMLEIPSRSWEDGLRQLNGRGSASDEIRVLAAWLRLEGRKERMTDRVFDFVRWVEGQQPVSDLEILSVTTPSGTLAHVPYIFTILPIALLGPDVTENKLRRAKYSGNSGGWGVCLLKRGLVGSRCSEILKYKTLKTLGWDVGFLDAEDFQDEQRISEALKNAVENSRC